MRDPASPVKGNWPAADTRPSADKAMFDADGALENNPVMTTEPLATPNDDTGSKSARRRQEIIAAATRLFDRQGYVNTALDDIARDVGIKREGLYYYFRNRAEILLSIIEPQSRALIDGLEAIVTREDLDPRSKLEAAIGNHLERFDRYCLEMTVSLRDGFLEDTAETRDRMNDIWRRYEALWERVVAEGMASGDYRQIGSPKMVAFGVLGMCNWLARWYDPTGPAGVDELCRTYASLVCDGLLTPSA